MNYTSNKYKLKLNNIVGQLYKDNKLLFIGNSKFALKMFIDKCDEGELKNKLTKRFKDYVSYHIKEKAKKFNKETKEI